MNPIEMTVIVAVIIMVGGSLVSAIIAFEFGALKDVEIVEKEKMKGGKDRNGKERQKRKGTRTKRRKSG